MDTRQLAAFVAVVEKKSFSQAAERLGVTQPAISLQIRALEERMGTQLLDRSGRRVEPTEAGTVLYRSAQKMLQLEQQLERELEQEETGELHGTLEFEPLIRDEIVLAVPPDHPHAGKRMPLERLREEPQLVMQEGAGVRQVVEEELRAAGLRLRDLEPKLELGLQESVKSAVAAGFGVAFISRTAIEGELAAGTLAAARVEGLEPARQIYVVRASGRMPTRAADGFLKFARAQLA